MQIQTSAPMLQQFSRITLYRQTNWLALKETLNHCNKWILINCAYDENLLYTAVCKKRAKRLEWHSMGMTVKRGNKTTIIWEWAMIVLLDQFCQLGGTSKKAICQRVIVSEFSEMPLSGALQVAYLPISNSNNKTLMQELVHCALWQHHWLVKWSRGDWGCQLPSFSRSLTVGQQGKISSKSMDQQDQSEPIVWEAGKGVRPGVPDLFLYFLG